MPTVEVIEITEEEKQMIIKKRAEDTRKAEINECFAQIKQSLARIEKLGGCVVLPSIGGKYVSHHNPTVRSTNISVWK